MYLLESRPIHPKPLILKRKNKAPSNKKIKEWVESSLEWYKEGLEFTNKEKPLFFGKKEWMERKQIIIKEIKNLEYELLKFTDPDAVLEVEGEIIYKYDSICIKG